MRRKPYPNTVNFTLAVFNIITIIKYIGYGKSNRDHCHAESTWWNKKAVLYRNLEERSKFYCRKLNIETIKVRHLHPRSTTIIEEKNKFAGRNSISGNEGGSSQAKQPRQVDVVDKTNDIRERQAKWLWNSTGKRASFTWREKRLTHHKYNILVLQWWHYSLLAHYFLLNSRNIKLLITS